MIDNSEFDGDIIYNGFIPNWKFKIFVYLYGGHYDENNNYIKCYYVATEIDDFNENAIDEIFKPGYSFGWDPFHGKHGIIMFSKLISGFENIQKYIDEIKTLLILKNIINNN